MPKKEEQEKQDRINELENRLAEAEETLRAIREGEVDAVVVSGTKGEQIFSLVGADSIYRLIVETMKEAAFTLSFEGQILFCNAQLEHLLKCPMERIVGHPLHEFITKSSHADSSTFLLTAQKQPVKQRLVFKASDGTPVPAHVASNVLNQPDGMSICVVANDLSELENSTELIQQLRRQQEALQAANEELAATEEELRVQNEELAASRAELDSIRARYQDLFETAPDGYVVTDPEGTIQEMNQAAANLLGRPASELKGNPFSALFVETAKEAYLRVLTSLTRGAQAIPKWEVETQRAKASPFWASINTAAARDEDGKIINLRWIIRDVTDRKRAEEATAAAHRQTQDVIDNTTSIVYAFDREELFVMANAAVAKLLNSTPEQMIGKRRHEFMPKEDADWHEANDRKVFETGSALEFEEHSQLKDHSITWLTTKFPLRDAGGKIYAVGGFSTDISERKRAEEKLRRSNKELEYFNNVMVDRELRMVELKKEIDHLCRQSGQPPRYGNSDHNVVDPGLHN